MGRGRLLILAAHLDLEAIRIRNQKARPACGAFAYLQTAPLQLKLQRGLDGLVSVPAGDRVRDVIDLGVPVGRFRAIRMLSPNSRRHCMPSSRVTFIPNNPA